ncbi:anti-sigma-F factor Fin family protein [Bacillus xiapuensis]|uniref:anti-sigma-F factor Fin family protein n=1 Tax=Bacillus xiapuensis TaxID=2014075 RepID=UPI000C24BCF8|nr:anti-sigma-F factor Fin family protein [Bacillus xiapuensis]
MPIHYICRHCRTTVGSLNQSVISAKQLGIHALTDQERTDMVHYDQDGSITITTICEDCQELLERNPEFHQYDYLIH